LTLDIYDVKGFPPSPYSSISPCCIRRGGHLGGEDFPPLAGSRPEIKGLGGKKPSARVALALLGGRSLTRSVKGGEREGIKRASIKEVSERYNTPCSGKKQKLFGTSAEGEDILNKD
jgi:hypothetical protein